MIPSTATSAMTARAGPATWTDAHGLRTRTYVSSRTVWMLTQDFSGGILIDHTKIECGRGVRPVPEDQVQRSDLVHDESKVVAIQE